VAPGVIMGHERNVATNTMLRKHGIEVVTIAGRTSLAQRGTSHAAASGSAPIQAATSGLVPSRARTAARAAARAAREAR
jgi:Arginine deiminase